MENIILQEYGESQPIDLNDEEITFIREKINENDKTNKIDIKAISGSKFRLKASSNVGVIQLPSGRYRIQIIPKIRDSINLIYMIRYTLDAKSKIYEFPSKFELGSNYLDIISFLFIQELETIITRGLYKSYKLEEENLNHLRGRINITEQINQNIYRNERLFCSYDELCFDNIENKTVLFALFILTQITQDKSLRSKTINLRNILNSEIPLTRVNIADVDKIHLSRLNQYYEKIIELSKTIIQNYYIDDLNHGKISAFSFLIDMNQLFEKFIGKVLKKEILKKFKVLEQSKAKNLLIPGDVTIKPDFIIKDEEGKFRLIIDTKYKQSPSHSDFYQIVSYSLAHEVDGVLLYPKSNQDMNKDYKIDKEKIDNKVYIRNVSLDHPGNLKEYINIIGKELEEIVNPLLV